MLLSLQRDVVIDDKPQRKVSFSSVTYDVEKQFIILHSDFHLPATTKFSLTLPYSGFFNQNNATGFFASSSVVSEISEQERQTKLRNFLKHGKSNRHQVKHNPQPKKLKKASPPYLFATQFEGSYARMAFPCLDEPQMKAYWTADFTVPEGYNYTVLFNTPETKRKREGGFVTHAFDWTPVVMSSYLVAIAIAPNYEYIEAKSNGLPYRIFVPVGKAALAQFSLNVSINFMNLFAKVLNFGYAFPKLDQIAVPAIIEDAMENWGLCTYDPSFLLVDPATAPFETTELVAEVVIHELSHQWFGDTVTFPWWSQGYLNEGFARWWQYYGIDKLQPSWESVWKGSLSFFNFAYLSAMDLDYTGANRPVVMKTEEVSGSQQSIENSFQGITYGKGASVNRYFSIYLGDEKWFSALGSRIKKYSFSNPDVTTLLNAFEEVQEGAADKFSPWLFQEGFPVVSVKVVKDKKQLSISQSRCSPIVPGTAQPWWLQLRIDLQNSNNSMSYLNVEMTDPATIMNLDSVPTKIRINSNFTFYGLVNYIDDEQWTYLLRDLVQMDEQRMILHVYSIFRLTSLSFVNITLPLRLTQTLGNNALKFPMSIWNNFFNQWFAISVVTRNETYYGKRVTPVISAALDPLVQWVGWNGSDPSAGSRSDILFWASYYDHSNVINTALNFFQKYAKEDASIPSELMRVVFYSAAVWSSSANQDDVAALMLNRLSKSTNAVEVTQLLFGLVNIRALDICQNVINTVESMYPGNTPSDLNTKQQVYSDMLKYNPVCQDLAWLQIQQVSDQLFSQNGFYAANQVLSSFDNAFAGDLKYKQVSNFLTKYSKWIPARSVGVSLAKIQLNSLLLSHNKNLTHAIYW